MLDWIDIVNSSRMVNFRIFDSWTEIENFKSILNFENFVSWIEDQIKNNHCKEITVRSHYGNSPVLEERWFERIEDGKIWRLVRPDAPFGGVFEEVTTGELERGVWYNARAEESVPEDIWRNPE